MLYALKTLDASDGGDVYDMLQEIPAEEMGFQNGANGLSREGFALWLARCDEIRRGENLAEGHVPQTVYWLYADGRIVGIGKLRHRLTDALLAVGGHIGYAVRPSRRGEGHGKAMLALLLREARAIGIDRALVTVSTANEPSIRVALSNGGAIEKSENGRHYVWIDTAEAI